jgi:hypothetical protein
LRIGFFQFFPPTLWTPGGGEVQLAKTKKALEELGVEVILFDIWSRRKDFDALHVFGSTYELSSFVQAAKGLGLPVIVSVIAYSAKPSWQWKVWKMIDPFLPLPTIYTLRQKIYDSADRLIVLSKIEAEQLSLGFRIDKTKIRYVPNGVDVDRFVQADPNLFMQRYGIKDFVLQVSRINKHKGQARLIRALKGTSLKLVFLGPLDPIDKDGVNEFLNLVEENKEWVYYLGNINHDDPLLASAYKAARVHVLPSISEVVPLVVLEAIAAGISTVSGKYPALYDNVGDRVYYCDPHLESSIKETVLKAYEKGPIPGAQDYVINNFSWRHTAEKLIKIYEEVIK